MIDRNRTRPSRRIADAIRLAAVTALIESLARADGGAGPHEAANLGGNAETRPPLIVSCWGSPSGPRPDCSKSLCGKPEPERQ
jgi:hypothetical protein